MINRLSEWLTVDRRQKIQVWFGSFAALLILLGVSTENSIEQVMIIAGAALQFTAAALSLTNLRVGEWGKGWAILRGAVYSLAGTVSPALVILGAYDDGTSIFVMSAVSLSLSSVSSGVAIFTSSKQETTPSTNNPN